MTDWRDVAALAAPWAPTLGKLLGGLTPVPGGSAMGEWAGNLLAKQFGVEAKPQVVQEAILRAPAETTIAALQKAEGAAQAEWSARVEIARVEAADRTAQAQTINETMRAEIGKVSAWHWRHWVGYVVGLWFVVPLPGLFWMFIRPDAATIAQITQLVTAVVPYVGIASALLGAVAWDTTNRYNTAMTGERSSAKVADELRRIVAKKL